MAIPKHWKKIPLGDLVVARKGKKPLKLLPSPFDSSVPYLDIKSLESNVIEKFADSFTSVEGRDTDIMVVWDGSRSGLATLGQNGAVGSTVMCLTPIFVNQKFLFYFIQSQYEFINSNTVGSSIPHVNPGLFYNIQVPLPPPIEQAQIVSEIESRLEYLKKQFATLSDEWEYEQEYRKSLLREAVTGRLSSKTNSKIAKQTNTYKSFQRLKFPSFWQVEKASEIFEVITSGSRNWSKYYSSSGALFIRVGNLSHISLDLDLSKEKLSYVKLPGKTEGIRTRLRAGDILTSITADIGSVSYIDKDVPEAYINQHIALLRAKPNYNSKFLAYFLASDIGQQQLLAKASGATKLGLSLEDIRSLEFCLPPLIEQKAIVKELDKLIFKSLKADRTNKDSFEKLEVLIKVIYDSAFTGSLLKTNNSKYEWPTNIINFIQSEKSKMTNLLKKKSATKSTGANKLRTELSSPKSIIEILANAPTTGIAVEEVWKLSTHYINNNVEAFYEELEKSMNKKLKKHVITFFKGQNNSTVILKLSKHAD